jgi:hypothetical protein
MIATSPITTSSTMHLTSSTIYLSSFTTNLYIVSSSAISSTTSTTYNMVFASIMNSRMLYLATFR